MHLKSILWIIFSIIILIFIYQTTNAVSLFSVNIPLLLAAFVIFLLSTFFWAIAWAVQMEKSKIMALKVNTKSLAGFFSPMSIGADALRAYFLKEQNPAEALASSFIIKFLKLVIIIPFLIVSIIIFIESPEFSNALFFLSSLILFTFFGMFLFWTLKTRKVNRFFYKLMKKEFIPKFRVYYSNYFKQILSGKTLQVLAWLFIASVLEIIAAFLVFQAVNIPVTWAHAFIFATVVNSLALVAITPQGVGFVEGGGYVILSFAFFSLNKDLIGTLLITWSIVRVWLPTLTGLIVTWADRL